MSFATYADLKTSIQTWLRRSSTAFTGSIADMVTLAEGRIFKELKVREMEAAYDETIATGTTPVPTDYIRFKVVYRDGSPIVPLDRLDLMALYRQYPTRSAEGGPKAIARNGANFEYGPYPDSAYDIKGTYYAKPLSLSDSQQTNTIFPAYSDVYLCAAMVEALDFVSDSDEMQKWEGKYQRALARANGVDEDEAYSGSLIQVRQA